jgi:hypothetical protein
MRDVVLEGRSARTSRTEVTTQRSLKLDLQTSKELAKN